MSNRILTIALSLVIAYFAVWLGDSVNTAFVKDAARGAKDRGGISGLIIIWVGLLFLADLILYAFWMINKMMEDESLEWFSAFILILSAHIFGCLAGPITKFGFVPWNWADPLVVLLIIGIVPAAHEVRSIAVDIQRAMREQRKKDNVRAIRT